MAYLASIGVTLLDATRPFIWSTRLGGVGFGDDDRLGWKAAGVNLFAYVVPPRCPDRQVPPIETIIITHSHGLQVALYAAAEGLKIDTLIDVAGPVRRDMAYIARTARQNIRFWAHLVGGKRDLWQVAGALFDGHLGIVREHPLADTNTRVPGAWHGGPLRDPALFSFVGRLLAEQPR